MMTVVNTEWREKADVTGMDSETGRVCVCVVKLMHRQKQRVDSKDKAERYIVKNDQLYSAWAMLAHQDRYYTKSWGTRLARGHEDRSVEGAEGWGRTLGQVSPSPTDKEVWGSVVSSPVPSGAPAANAFLAYLKPTEQPIKAQFFVKDHSVDRANGTRV